MKAGEEPGNVERDLPPGSPPFESGDPLAHEPHLLFGVVLSGDDQSSELYMAGLYGALNKAHYHAPVAAQDFRIIPVREPLKIYVHSINIRQDLLKDRQLSRPVADQYVHHSGLMDKFCSVPYKFISHKRLIIGKCNADIALIFVIGSSHRDLLRRDDLRVLLAVPDLLRPGDLVILAERAAQVASIAAGREYAAAGHKSVQRLFLNGIQCQRSQLSVVGRPNHTSRADSRAAEAHLSFFQVTMPEAHLASGHSPSLPSQYRLNHAFTRSARPSNIPSGALRPQISAAAHSGPTRRSRPCSLRWRSAAPPYLRRPDPAAEAPSFFPLSR